MDINKFKELLDRYLNGTTTEEEKALIEAWYKTYAVDEQELSDIEAAQVRDAIRSKIQLETPKKRVISLPVLRIAASVLIATSVSLLVWRYLKPKPAAYLTFQTGMRGMKKVTLPDNSIVWLNAETKLKVRENFDGKTRIVILEGGEAFFDVKHDTDHPFVVKVNELNVQVLGTSFNIRSYKDMGRITVAVASGKVGITKANKTLSMLLPDDELNYVTRTGTYTNERVISGRAQSWKSGYTYLSDADFNELAVIVKNLFGLSIKTSSKTISNYHFTCRVNHNIDAGQLLSMISELHNTHYRKEGNAVVLY
jgi:ferric-dicitrate binding protein FerR (iron transport regulator)